ncbi:U32 family peptidase C-terminal domain-containing protein [Candidatus Hepatincolaceae symbiont of Richtersius coronifer]
MLKSELLLPGGNFRKIKTAMLYGADSVYAGTPDMSLRAKSELSLEDLIAVSHLTKKNNKKLYLTLNLFSHNKDIEKLPSFLDTVAKVNPDGLLIADPGIFAYFRKHMPNMNLHISTQANVCSSLSVDFWKDQGASLCVLAREVSFEEITEIKQQCKNIKIEAFVHGSMCMTYSGRCLLSNFMAERGANQGSCAHSCRWDYKVKIRLKDNKIFELNLNEENKDLFNFYLEEEFREGEYYPIEEDGMGSYILNSKDLCLMPVLDDYLKLGVDTLKIEGRNKSEYYAAITARSYRYAIDAWYKDPENWNYKPYMEELNTIQNRGYTLAFHKGRLTNLGHNYDTSGTLSSYMFAGIVVDYDKDHLIMEIKNLLNAGDILEFISPFFMEPIRLRMYDFIETETGDHKSKIAPGKANQTINIPLALFHNENKENIKNILPLYSVVRKLNFKAESNLFLKQNNVAFKVENNKASQNILTKVKKELNLHLNEEELKKASQVQGLTNKQQNKSFKSIDDACCSKGCNGCLVFWNDEKYAALREKLKQKKSGEMLIKNIDF